MDILKFSLKGKSAFFKKPEVNSYFSFTYGNIHKVALLGMFGAILGYGGYASMDSKKEKYPEFYEKLKNIQCAIIPKNQDGYINKKIQYFNNSVGYASNHGNLIVKEQWLENPSWNIYVALDCEEAMKMAEFILSRKCIYIPYLGKNDHPADIGDVHIYKECIPTTNFLKIDSLFLKRKASFGDPEDYEEEYDWIKEYKYEEHLPIALNSETQMYEMAVFVHSNLPVERYEEEVYQLEETICFF